MRNTTHKSFKSGIKKDEYISNTLKQVVIKQRHKVYKTTDKTQQK